VALVSVLLTVRGASVDARNSAALVAAAWWLSPLAYYWYRVRTVTGAWVLGAGYIAASAYMLFWIYGSDGSTAALGFLFAPILLWTGILMAVDVDRAVARWASLRRHPRSVGAKGKDEGVVRIGRAPSRAASAWWQWMVPTGAALAFVGALWWNVYAVVAAVIWSGAGALAAVMTERQGHAASG
jgi:hypothetical protein